MKQLFITLFIFGLINSTTLNRVATCRAWYLKTFNIWSHDNWTYCFKVKGVYGHIGEVLSKNFSTQQGAIDAWMKSPTHKTVMTNPIYKMYGYADTQGYKIMVFGE